MSEKHALLRAFLYAVSAVNDCAWASWRGCFASAYVSGMQWDRGGLSVTERLGGVCFLCAVGRGGLSVTERLDGACFLYAVGLELNLYSC